MSTARPFRPEVDLADMAAELTRSHVHRERYERRKKSRYHPTQVPSLIDQLEQARPSGKGDDRGAGGYESRPAARIEALDVLLNIGRESDHWLVKLDLLAAGAVRVRLRRLYTHLWKLEACKRKNPRKRCCDRHMLEADFARWYTQARVVTGWDSAAWRPANTCPQCGEFGSLRVKHIDEAALCVECFAHWDSATIGILADHIRLESEVTRLIPRASVTCWCPVPEPEPDTLRLCPACGSSRCIRAITIAPVLDTPDVGEVHGG